MGTGICQCSHGLVQREHPTQGTDKHKSKSRFPSVCSRELLTSAHKSHGSSAEPPSQAQGTRSTRCLPRSGRPGALLPSSRSLLSQILHKAFGAGSTSSIPPKPAPGWDGVSLSSAWRGGVCGHGMGTGMSSLLAMLHGVRGWRMQRMKPHKLKP